MSFKAANLAMTLRLLLPLVLLLQFALQRSEASAGDERLPYRCSLNRAVAYTAGAVWNLDRVFFIFRGVGACVRRLWSAWEFLTRFLVSVPIILFVSFIE